MKIVYLLLCATLTILLPQDVLFAADQSITKKLLTPENTEVDAQSKQLYAEQLSANLARAKQINHGRLWFAGFGLDSGSQAFRGDVNLVQNRIAQINPTLLSFVMDNHPQTEKLDRPFAHFGNLNETIKHVAKNKHDGDVFVLFISAHGNVPFLATQIAYQRFADITASQLANSLNALQDLPTVIVISACHSGSLIPDLEKPTRIILTAASKDKTSYGCQPLANNTFFVEEYFGDHFDPKQSLKANFESSTLRIASREANEKLIPSEPQIFIGEKMKAFADQGLSDWLSLSTPKPPAKVAK